MYSQYCNEVDKNTSLHYELYDLQGINTKLLTQIEELKAVQDVSSLAYEQQIAKLKEENTSLAVSHLNNPPHKYTSAKTLEERLNKDAFIKTLENQNQRLRKEIDQLKRRKKKPKPVEL